MGLGNRILGLMAAGTVTSQDIADRLTAEGFIISQPTVSRWLKEYREQQKSETQKLVSDHVKTVIPADLTALEEMELQCIERARETKGDFAHRLAALYINEQLDTWRTIFRELETDIAADPAHKAIEYIQAVKSIMAQCIIMMSNDLALEKMRGNARRTAALIIDLKLKHTLGDSGGSNIIIGAMDNETPGYGSDNNTLVFQGGGG
jgi:arginine repressor